jgi:hypothetical protein
MVDLGYTHAVDVSHVSVSHVFRIGIGIGFRLEIGLGLGIALVDVGYLDIATA